MTLDKHPYSKPYLHIPTGRIIFLQNAYTDGSYQAHFNFFGESLIVWPEDLRIPDQAERDEQHFNYQKLK